MMSKDYLDKWEERQKQNTEIIEQQQTKTKKMKKILIISVTVLGIVLAIVGGYYTVELVKLMGANFLTVKGVVGCYFIPFLIVAALCLETIMEIDRKF